jgi:hypothetical protein
MKEGLEREGKVASKGSFDLLEAFVFLQVIDKSIFLGGSYVHDWEVTCSL